MSRGNARVSKRVALLSRFLTSRVSAVNAISLKHKIAIHRIYVLPILIFRLMSFAALQFNPFATGIIARKIGHKSNDENGLNEQRRALTLTVCATLLAFFLGANICAAQSIKSVSANLILFQSNALPVESNEDANAAIVEGEQAGDVLIVGRKAIVRGQLAKGVIVLGGDCVVEGRVAGDVGVVGGSAYQRAGSYIGGDVIVLGGTYHHGKSAPGRNPDSTTVMFAGLEAETRRMFREPASLLRPALTPVYFAQRLLAALFWFVISVAVTWVAPGAISRAAARLQLTSLRVALIGILSAVAMISGASLALRFTPSWFSTIVGVMLFLIFLAAYFYGRIVVQAATGRWLQRLYFRGTKRGSETTALLIGALVWCALLSLPFIWSVLTMMLFVLSLGLAFTARYRLARKPEV